MQNQNQHTDGNPPIFNAYPQQDQRYNLYDNNIGDQNNLHAPQQQYNYQPSNLYDNNMGGQNNLHAPQQQYNYQLSNLYDNNMDGQNNLHAPQQQYNYQPSQQIIQNHSYNQDQNSQLPTQTYLQEQSHFKLQSNKRKEKERQRRLQPIQGNRNAEFIYVGVNNTGSNQIPMPPLQTDVEQGCLQSNWDVIVGVSPSRRSDKSSPAKNTDPGSCCLGFYILDQSMCIWIVTSFYYVMICPFKIIQFIFGGLWRTCCAQSCSRICPSLTFDFTSFCQIIESTCSRCFEFVLKGSNNLCGSICFCCKNDCTGQVLCNTCDSIGQCFGSIFECLTSNLSKLCECLLSNLSACFECFISNLRTCCECFASYLSSCCECFMGYCEIICDLLGRCLEFICSILARILGN